MARILINKEEAFQVLASRFCIGQSASGYTLNYGVDGVHFTPWTDGTLADTDQVVINAVPGMYFKLVGNTSDGVPVTW